MKLTSSLSYAISLLLIGFAGVTAAGCSAETFEEEVAVDHDEIVEVPQTDVERQSIGNCWLYAQASWAESMHKSATGRDFDVSQSYWTYWHWFDQIAANPSMREINTGGNFATANAIIKKYGLIAEKDFIPADARAEMSVRQEQALEALNESLKTGALSKPETRRDKAALRREMDRAWGLSPEVSAMLDRVFGEKVTKTFARGSAKSEGTPVIAPEDFEVAYTTGPGRPLARKSLKDAMNEWRQSMAMFQRDRRGFYTRIQRALHDRQPVIMSWLVDFNALDSTSGPMRGSFTLERLNRLGPGDQGGHMTVLEDYQVELPDGRVLKAGVTLDPSNPQHAKDLSAALDPRAKIVFFRVKNSWGTARPDRGFAPSMPGYHDLYMDYLEGPIRRCQTREDGETDTKNCPDWQSPMQDVVLPPGY